MARPRALARLTQIDTVLFDKTGTLTQPEMKLAEVLPLTERDAGECRKLAAALERDLTHPIARALSAGVTDLPTANVIRLLPGGGVSGFIGGHRYWIGAAAQAPASAALPSGPAAEQAGWLMLCEDDRPLALFALRADLRPEAPALLASLRAQGLEVELLTGDAEGPARALADLAGISRVRARQSPEQKLSRLRELQAQGRVVMAVGDGINDAPFLAAADVAVAMPQGAALAQARADVVLVGDSLSGVATLRRVARQAQRRLRQNLAWALGYNLVVLPLALGGWLTPWLAALGMSLSSLLVISNALRLNTGEA
jgi:Cu2+-exporting ATPase